MTFQRKLEPFDISLRETWGFLRREFPQQLEDGALQHAIEQSLLGWTIALRCNGRREGTDNVSPAEVLGVAKGASAEEIRTSYRRRALELHPDKGGDVQAFLRLQWAYKALTQQPTLSEELFLPLPAPPLDFNLREHREVVRACFERHGADLELYVQKQKLAVDALALGVCDMGAVNVNEWGERMHNQCFYLSIARAYLAGVDSTDKQVKYMALQMKRVIEAAVLQAHPEWGGTRVGEDVQAFSDFLFFVIGPTGLLSELAFAIFDSVSGFVEIYKGKCYPDHARESEQSANLLILNYTPGHYQALIRSHRAGPTLGELQHLLDEFGVLYIVTDG